MAKRFQPQVHEAVELIWNQYDKECGLKGQAMLREAAEGGDMDAWAILARTYMGVTAVGEMNGLGFVADDEKVHECLLKSIKGGSAIGVLCAIADKGLHPTEHEAMLEKWESPEKVIEAMQEYTGKGGEPLASYLLGIAYDYGSVSFLRGSQEGELELLQTALPYLEEAVQGGFAFGMDTYKKCVRSSCRNGGDMSQVEKYRRYEDGFCRSGYPHALWSRAEDLYEEERYRDAFALYEKAAKAGHENSLYNLGYMYRHGQGVKEDPRKAFEEYFLPLALQGHVTSMYQVADLYFWGDYFERDFDKAFEWCGKSLDKIAQCHDFYNYDVLMPLICYCKLYGRGTSMAQEAAARSIREEMTREEQQEMLPPYKRALLQYLMAEVYEHGYGGLPQNEKLAEQYRSAATEYKGFQIMLSKLSWEKAEGAGAWKSLAAGGSNSMDKADTFRSWQDERTERAEGRRPWKLSLEWEDSYGVSFWHYDRDELRAALELNKRDVYISVLLNKNYKGCDYLGASFDGEKYYLQAKISAGYTYKEEKDPEAAAEVLAAWAEGKGLVGEGWQNDEDAQQRRQWNDYLHEADECQANDDDEGRIAALKAAADIGCGHAMNLLGIICGDDFKTASQWFLNATTTKVREDVVSAWYSLGRLHLQHPEGSGSQAMYYLQKAADMGETGAWVQLGICHLKGIGTVQDYERGVACYEKGIELGDYEAMYARAMLCQDEEGEWHDPDTAIRVLQRAAAETCEENHYQNEARLLLAKALMAKDEEANYDQARALVRKAAGEGCLEAVWTMSHFYKLEDNFRAYRKVLRDLVDDGYEPAREELDEMYATSEWSECL